MKGDPRPIHLSPLWENTLLALSLLLLLSDVVGLLFLSVFVPPWSRALGAETLVHVTVGRETALYTAISQGVPWPLAFAQGAITELVVLFGGYALLSKAGRGLLRIPWISRISHRPHPVRDLIRNRTERVGVLVLAAALWIPFLPGGALFFSLVGRAAGYRLSWLLPVLALSSLVSLAFWALLSTRLFSYFPTRPWVVALALALLTILGGALFTFRKGSSNGLP